MLFVIYIYLQEPKYLRIRMELNDFAIQWVSRFTMFIPISSVMRKHLLLDLTPGISSLAGLGCGPRSAFLTSSQVTLLLVGPGNTLL